MDWGPMMPKDSAADFGSRAFSEMSCSRRTSAFLAAPSALSAIISRTWESTFNFSESQMNWSLEMMSAGANL